MNYLGNGIVDLHYAFSHASYEGFPEYEYQTRDWEEYKNGNKEALITKSCKHSDYTMAIFAMFVQTWGSTALGFGGVGGQAITSAYVVVLESSHGYGYCVYFGKRFAYRIKKPNQQFFDDIITRRLCSVSDAHSKYETAA